MFPILFLIYQVDSKFKKCIKEFLSSKSAPAIPAKKITTPKSGSKSIKSAASKSVSKKGDEHLESVTPRKRKVIDAHETNDVDPDIVNWNNALIAVFKFVYPAASYVPPISPGMILTTGLLFLNSLQSWGNKLAPKGMHFFI